MRSVECRAAQECLIFRISQSLAEVIHRQSRGDEYWPGGRSVAYLSIAQKQIAPTTMMLNTEIKTKIMAARRVSASRGGGREPSAPALTPNLGRLLPLYTDSDALAFVQERMRA
jgi:hypothetical protein